MKTKPFAHQQHAHDLSALRENFALFMDTGTGKSWQLLDTAETQFRAGMIDTLLVLAPAGPHRDWPEHVAAHLSDDTERVCAFYSSGYQRKAFRDALEAPASVLRVISMNIEALSHKSGLELVHAISKKRKVLLGIDESQRIKTPSSKRTRSAWAAGRHAVSRRVMTGSAITRGLHNLYAQFRFLDPSIIGARTYKAFKDEYCVTVGEFDKIVGFKNVEWLMARLKPHMFQVLAEDCLDLPERRYITRSIELSDQQRRYYRQFRDAFVLELDHDRGVLTIQQIVTRYLRLQQILCGHVPNPDEKGYLTLEGCPRLEVLGDDIENSTAKGIIWARFQPDVQLIAKELASRGIGHRCYYGPMNEETRARALLEWRNESKYPWLIATQSTGGVGLTLNEASAAHFYSNSFSWEHRKQAEARNWRIGQTKRVTYYDYIVPGSIDTKIRKAHETAKDVSELLTSVRDMRDWMLGTLREDSV